jgi:hypothetical protein
MSPTLNRRQSFLSRSQMTEFLVNTTVLALKKGKTAPSCGSHATAIDFTTFLSPAQAAQNPGKMIKMLIF